MKNRAKNIGLYILGASLISEESRVDNFPTAFSEKDLPSLEERAKIIKSQGAKVINQINHAGAYGNFNGLSPVVPSAEIAKKDSEKRGENLRSFHELSENEIIALIDKFAYATELSIKAGYDGVEIHGANNFLIQQFYSPHTNKRNDQWGGNDEKRMKFALKIVDAVCKVREKYKVPEFIIGYRLSPEEPYEDGITMTETLKLIKNLISKPIQYIHVSQKDYFKKARRGEGSGIERLKLIHDEIKGKVALIGVGGLLSGENIKKASDSGFSDFVAVGGASLLNKELGTLLKEGKYDEINVEIDPEKKEIYSLPNNLWNMCMQNIDWLPPVKGKPRKKE